MKSIILMLILISLTGCGIEQVDEGYRGIEKKWGKVSSDPLMPGLYFYNPISTDIDEMSVREEILQEGTTVFTKDTQMVVVSFAVTFYPDPKKIAAIYSQFGNQWESKTVKPAVLNSLKDAIGQYIADDLVSKREIAKKRAEDELKEALKTRDIFVTRLDFTNLDFDDEYEKAVEAKVVAVQRAAESKNKTIQIAEEAKQKIETAKAEAESMKIKTQALSQSKSLVSYEAVQKWDGALPKIILGNGSMPMLDLNSIMKSKGE